MLTYKNGSASNESIPTLEEFLIAGKGKILFKFDLKSGVSGKILEILDLVVATGMENQVLIRGGMFLLEQAKNNGYDTKIIMPKLDDVNTDGAAISALTDQYSIRAISLPNGATQQAVDTANAMGLVVEIHESQDANERQSSWEQAISDGYRQIHSFKPILLRNYLGSIDRH